MFLDKKNIIFALVSILLLMPQISIADSVNTCAKYSFGVSPPYIKMDKLVPGENYTEEIDLWRSCQDGEYLLEVSLNAPGLEDWLSFDPAEDFKFAAGRSRAVLRARIDVPPDTETGEYKGSMLVTMAPPPPPGSGTVIRTKIGIRLAIDLVVGGEKDKVVAAAGDPASYTAENYDLYDHLRGRIILKVGDAGKAFYVHPVSKIMYYLGRPADAFRVMREQGIGATDSDLAKIPLGLDHLSGADSDGDGLPDAFEDAIGFDKEKSDSDGDGNSDYNELVNPILLKQIFNPSSKDIEFSQAQAGRILLAVEGRGEAWYVNPIDGKRYFLSRPADAFNVMKNLGLGISNRDFSVLTGRGE